MEDPKSFLPVEITRTARLPLAKSWTWKRATRLEKDVETCLCNNRVRYGKELVRRVSTTPSVSSPKRQDGGSLAKRQQILKAGRLAQFRGEQIIFQEDLVADVGSFKTSRHPARPTTSGLYSSPASSANCCWKEELPFFHTLPLKGRHRAGAPAVLPQFFCASTPLQHDENVIELSHQSRLRYFRGLPQREDENGTRKENNETAIGKRQVP